MFWLNFKSPLIVLFPVIALLSVAPVSAGTLILNDGQKIEGTILRETPESVTIKTQFSETIFEEQIIPKSKIRDIQRQRRNTESSDALKEIVFPETAVSESTFNRYITEVEKLLAKFRQSEGPAGARELLRKAVAERERVRAGEIKLNGIWLTEKQIAEEEYQVAALRLLESIQRQKATADIRNALNDFRSLEEKFPGSAAYIEAVGEARTLLDTYSGLLEHEIRNFPIKEAERERRMQLESPSTQENMKAAREREISGAKLRIEQAKASGQTFFPHSQADIAGMQELFSLIQAERERLRQLDTEPFVQSLRAVQQARDHYEKRELTAAMESNSRALRLWPDNEMAVRLDSQITASIEARKESDETQKEAVDQGFTSSFGEAAEATASPSPSPSAPPSESSPTPGED